MKKGATHFAPNRKDAIVRQLRDEFIVYDKETNHAHCLNSTSRCLEAMRRGEESFGDHPHHGKGKSPIDERLVWMALRKLNKAGLLLEPVPSPPKA